MQLVCSDNFTSLCRRWTQLYAPTIQMVLQVVGRWLLGWAVVAVFLAVLQGRLRFVHWFLCLPAFAPIAALSYSAYLLQFGPYAFMPSWASVGVTTMPAAWGYALLAFLVVVLASLALALPAYLLVERPFMQLWCQPVFISGQSHVIQAPLDNNLLAPLLSTN
jgi:peptidoglycan/LPS O-acetylase OafA/YrhL